MCGTGIGVSICANKVRGVRCALCTDETMARLRANITTRICWRWAAGYSGTELAKGVVKTSLETEFSNGQRHINRIAKITQYENK
ncbi:MAG: RpiB/LacA/LacB family sugar-phosphate isomerase [Christensenellales bacterium]